MIDTNRVIGTSRVDETSRVIDASHDLLTRWDRIEDMKTPPADCLILSNYLGVGKRERAPVNSDDPVQVTFFVSTRSGKSGHASVTSAFNV